MDDFALLVSLYRHDDRLGPGSDAATRLALDLAGLRGRAGMRVADLGCGTGASTLVLAKELDAHITAVDLFPEFLEELSGRARERGVSARISPLAASFDDLPFEDGTLDVIWSEGAIYNPGFEAGVRAWRPYLGQGGILAVSEITWLTAERPEEIQSYWDAAYPEIATASEKLGVLEANGFSPIGYFTLPEACWLENFYRPLRARFPRFLEEHAYSEAARALVDETEREISLYERFRDYVSYGFYVARRLHGHRASLSTSTSMIERGSAAAAQSPSCSHTKSRAEAVA
jgi:SAM-dependent methyltransferase